MSFDLHITMSMPLATSYPLKPSKCLLVWYVHPSLCVFVLKKDIVFLHSSIILEFISSLKVAFSRIMHDGEFCSDAKRFSVLSTQQLKV